jgi:hypothetical protein
MTKNINIDDEWEKFMCDNNSCYLDSDNEEIINEFENENYCDKTLSADIGSEIIGNAPKTSNIYISTKTKIAYLNNPVDLKDVFWNIPVIPYAMPCDGVIKKQMKFNSLSIEDLLIIQKKLVNEPYFEEHVITSINNPNGRIKFKDIRKISVGVSKKDLLSYRCKKKSAFYNCFVLILRIKIDDVFKEFHVKVFNTGKLEIPGIQNETSFNLILQHILNIIQPHVSFVLGYKPDSNETVLINSNFNCGYFIDRESLFDILKFKYNIQAIYDPCSYPGIQCKFYYNPEVGIQTGCQISEENKELYTNISEVSFMIFRTGSVLIVGKCDENVLYIIYEFLKTILSAEYIKICQKNMNVGETSIVKNKKKKIRRKNITINMLN